MTAPIACRCARVRLPMHPTPEELRAVSRWLVRVQVQQARETEDRLRRSCKPLFREVGVSLPRAAVEDDHWSRGQGGFRP